MNTKRAILLVAALAVCAASIHAFNVDSLLTASVGGKAAVDTLKAMKSFHAEGIVKLNGREGRFIEWFAPPDRLYLELKFDQFSLVQGYDGTTAWQQDANGMATELGGYEKRELLKTIYFESFAFVVPGRVPGSYEYHGEVMRDGVTYLEIAFHPLNADTVLVHFDKKDGLRKFMLSRLDNVETYTAMDQYRKVSGVLVPMYAKSTAPDAPLTVEFVTSSASFNDPVNEAIFSMPTHEAKDFRFPEGKTQITIPFDYRFGQIYVPVTINGVKRVWMILDSGSSVTVFHQPAIADLTLAPAGTMPTKGLGGFQNSTLVRTDSLTIGDLTLFHQIGGSMDLKGIGQKGPDGGPFGGVIGYDFLSRFPMLIDYQSHVLRVFNPDNFTAPEGGKEMPFHLTMQVPTVAGELAGDTGSFIVDLGNAFGLIVHHRFAEQNELHKKLLDVHESAGVLGGVGGGVPGKSGFATEFRFGPVMVDSLRVMMPASSEGLAGSEELAGNIGNGILQRFRPLFDYHNQRIILYPIDKLADPKTP